MVALKYTVKDDKLQVALKAVAGRMVDPAPALDSIGRLLLRSIAQNFKAGGRPIKWKPSRRARREGGQTLIDTARLRNSITKRVEGKTLYVGTNVAYAAIHQFGGRIRKNVTVKQHWRYMDKAFGKPIPARHQLVKNHGRKMDFTMPARPFLLIQDTDRRYMDSIVASYVVSG